jgi:hypothetical protein
MIRHLLASFVVLFLLDAWHSASAEQELLDRRYQAFSLSTQRTHHATSAGSGEKGWVVKTTGTDPYVFTEGLTEACDPYWDYFVAFQYKAPEEFGAFQVLFQTAKGVQVIKPAIESTDSWKWCFVELTNREQTIEWLRFDFGDHANRRFEIRDCRLIRKTPEYDPAKEPHTPFTLASRGHHANIDRLPGGGWTVKTTGNDPYVATAGLAEALDPNTPYIIAFEYQAPTDFGDFTFYYRTADGIRHVDAGVKPSERWAWHLFDFSADGKGLGQELKSFRIDFGDRTGLSFKIRNCRLIKATTELRIRAAIGDRASRIDSFGISLRDVTRQRSSSETVRHRDDKSVIVTKSTYRHLDLDAETKRFSDDPAAQPPVPLGPRLVAGEGEHPDNHSVVRILSRYQVCETQFLAFPPEIRGGVGVECGRLVSGEAFITTWPLTSAATRQIRFFNRHGGTIGQITIPKDHSPPFTVTVGEFDADRAGDEVAVASRYDATGVGIFSIHCEQLDLLELPERESKKRSEYSLLYAQERLIAQDLASGRAYPIHPRQSAFDFPETNSPVRLFDSVYEDRDFNLGGREATVSTLHTWKKGAPLKQLDAGQQENIFWLDPQEVHGGSEANWQPLPDGKYIKNSKYNFLGPAQNWSPLLETGDIQGKTHAEWVDWKAPLFQRSTRHRKSLTDYDKGVPTVWSAGFTHRWHSQPVKAIVNQRSPKTRLPLYLLLDRKNESIGGGYFGKRLFDYGSQNFEQEALRKFYTACQREFHRQLAPRYRQTPEMTIAVEPNHENEIVSGRHSVGDYNPKSIEGFYQYLLALYGDLHTVNDKMGTAFTLDFFDAPRALLRGEWDRYELDNLYFREWVEYNRIQIYRRVGTSYREALLAGFPPELIKCHQIPASYVFGSIVGISEGEVRISPIDWLLTTGAGFGFSRYGTYYQREHNIGQGAHSSGFDGMLIGEYASLNPSSEKALEQLLYLRNHGVSSLHVMWWPEHLDKGFNRAQDTALRQLIANHDEPKPGLAGGVDQVRAYEGSGGSAYDIASLGTGADHTGLIKSLKEDGSFEGTVYTVPFHAHVDVEMLYSQDSLLINASPTSIGNVKSIRQGAAIEVTFKVVTPGKIRLGLSNAAVELEEQRVDLDELTAGQNVRVVYKLPLVLAEVSLQIFTTGGEAEISDLIVIRHQDQAINLTTGIMAGKRHQGGVSFDVLAE